jgi:hypothetical protein
MTEAGHPVPGHRAARFIVWCGATAFSAFPHSHSAPASRMSEKTELTGENGIGRHERRLEDMPRVDWGREGLTNAADH